MTYREKFHYSAILIKTSNISICIIHSYKKRLNTYINIDPSISTGKIFQKLLLYFVLE